MATQEFTEYIKELLYRHDCVIIPQLGGFVGSYSPAAVHPVTHTFHPPFKKILFNENLKNNDGLLAQFISTRKNIPFSHANSMIDQFVAEIKRKLEREEKVILEGLGIFILNSEHHIEFTPSETTNFLESSYGLIKFTSPPVVRSEDKKVMMKPFVDRKPASRHSPVKKRAHLAAVLITGMIIIAGWAIMNLTVIKDFSANYTGLLDYFNAFSGPVTEMPVNTHSGSSGMTGSADAPSKEKDALNTHSTKYHGITFTHSDKNDLIVPHSINQEQPVVSETKYYIIAGAFRNHNNAEKLVVRLKNKGYNASYAGLTGSGLLRVAYDAVAIKEEALELLARIRSDENQAAWIHIE